jgi:hypothetical protein
MNDKDPDWLSVIVEFLSEFLSDAHAKKFLEFWHRVHRRHSPNDELLPIMHLLGYLNLFTVKILVRLASTNSEMERLRQSIETHSELLKLGVADLRRQAAETSQAARRASEAAERAASSRLPYTKLLLFNSISVLGTALILTVGFLLLAHQLPATNKSAQEYQYELTTLKQEINDLDDQIHQDQLIRQQMLQQLNAKQPQQNGIVYPPGSEGGFKIVPNHPSSN